MADTLTNIQTDVRFYANESDINLTTGINLRISNAMYRAMGTPGYRHRGVKIGRRWKEFTREDTSLTMVASQEQYTWPASPVFNEPFFIEGLDVNASNAPYIILPAPNMTTWSYFDDKNDARPLYSRLIDDSGTVKANPFTASATGFWFWYADDARYDVRLSAGGIVTPFTIGDILLDDTKNDVTTIVSVSSSATPTFDASLGTIFTNTLTANVTSSTISNPVTGQRIEIYLAQDGVGGFTFAWPANVQLRKST
ncbi:hypothetical protein LCGC14_2063120, partial [marine sediment metagenome]